jgi:hypothetical protein
MATRTTAPSANADADPVGNKVLDFLNDDSDMQTADPATETTSEDSSAVVDPTPEPAPRSAAPAAPTDFAIPADVLGIPETKVDETDDIPAPPEVSKDPKAAYTWQSLKNEVKELKAQLAAQSAVPKADPEEVLKLREQLSSYEEKLGQYDLTATREFQQKFEAPSNHLKRRAIQLLQRGGKDAAAAEVIVKRISDPSLSFDQVQDILADEPLAVQGALVNIATELTDLEASKAEAVKNWKETRAALNVKQQRESEIRLAENIETATAEALQEAIRGGNFMLQPSQDEHWNKQVQERVLAAKGIIRNAKPAELIKYVLEGITAAPLRQHLQHTYQLAEQRKAELEKVLGTRPKNGAGASPTGGPARGTQPMTPEQKIKELFDDEPGGFMR